MILSAKKWLFSENGMKFVNLLFFLSILVRNGVFTICAFSVWIALLAHSIRMTKSRTVRIIYGILCLYAAVTILVNLYFMLLV